jgi:signal peptidase II
VSREQGAADGATDTGGDVAAKPVAPSRTRLAVFGAVAVAVLALDVVSKVLVAADLPQTHAPKRVLGGAVYLDQARNSGAAFSLGTGFTVVLTVVALAVIVLIARIAKRLRSTGWAISLGLILGGAVGNLADRVLRSPGFLRGRVVDWISLFGPDGKHWPIFNLADSAIVCGAVLAALLTLFGVEIDARRSARGSR